MAQIIDTEGDKVGGFAHFEAADVIAPQRASTTLGGQCQGFTRRETRGIRFETGPADTLQEHRLARFAKQVVAVIAGRTVDAEADAYTGIDHGAYRGDA